MPVAVGVGVEQRIEELGRADAVLEPRSPPTASRTAGTPPSPWRTRPLRRVALAEVHLVGGVAGQDLQQRDADDGLHLARDGAHGHLLRVSLQLLSYSAVASASPPTAGSGARVLLEVDGRVQRRCRPDDVAHTLASCLDWPISLINGSEPISSF
jgi:hypothetical protein